MRFQPPLRLEGDDRLRRLAPGSWYSSREVELRTGAPSTQCLRWLKAGKLRRRPCPVERRMHRQQRWEYSRACPGPERIRRQHHEVRSLDEYRAAKSREGRGDAGA